MVYFQNLTFKQIHFFFTKVILTMTFCLRSDYFVQHTYIHTFNVVTFDNGTNFPAVRWNPLLAVAMTNIRHR
jgi:hypothetical protein